MYVFDALTQLQTADLMLSKDIYSSPSYLALGHMSSIHGLRQLTVLHQYSIQFLAELTCLSSLTNLQVTYFSPVIFKLSHLQELCVLKFIAESPFRFGELNQLQAIDLILSTQTFKFADMLAYTRLQRLKLELYGEVSAQDWQNLSFMTQLKKLKFVFKDDQVQDLQALASLTQLTSIKLQRVQDVMEYTSLYLTSLVNLCKIWLQHDLYWLGHAVYYKEAKAFFLDRGLEVTSYTHGDTGLYMQYKI